MNSNYDAETQEFIEYCEHDVKNTYALYALCEIIKLKKERRRLIVAILIVSLLFVGALWTTWINTNRKDIHTEPVVTEGVVMDEDPVVTPEPVAQPVQISEPIVEVKTHGLTEAEIDLIALVTMAEAEGEPVEGKRLVIDTILNRIDSSRWPNTVNGVIYQANQFECMWNGRTSRCYVRDDIRQLVLEELVKRTNTEVVFFMAGGYSKYGIPLFQVGNHYFSKI